MALTLENVGKSYGVRRVLHAMTLKAEAGEAISVTGVNGSGKSTLLKVIAGLVRASRGQVTFSIGGKSWSEAGSRRECVGYAGPDLMFYPELTGRENLLFFAAMRGEKADDAGCDAVLEVVGLGGRGNDAVGAYSSGMRQRLRLAFAMRAEAPLLLIDEPSLALDESGVALVGRMVRQQRERGGITMIATNDPREAALGDRTIALSS